MKVLIKLFNHFLYRRPYPHSKTDIGPKRDKPVSLEPINSVSITFYIFITIRNLLE